MEKHNAVLTILCSLVSIDRHIDEREIDVIEAYIKKNYENYSAQERQDLETLIRSFEKMPLDEKYKNIEESAVIVKQKATEKEIYRILEWAFTIIFADLKFERDEVRAFEILGKAWGIDTLEWGKNLLKALQ